MKNDKSFGLIDDLTISHNGNQISSVTDAVDETLDYEGAFDFVDGEDKDKEYAYNGNGALTKDLNKGIQNIEYDLLGNPKKITLANNYFIEYVYAADGRRLRTKHYRLLPNPSYSSLLLRGERYLQIGDSIDYVGNLILKNGKPQMYQFAGGYYSFDGDKKPECHYYIADYQGNNRMVVNAHTDSIEQVTHYYPYGGIIGNLSSNQEAQKYKFGGKELDRTYGFDLYDFHARLFNPALPGFDRPDPLAEKYYSISPYAYCAGDPVNLVDPTGMKPTGYAASLMAGHVYNDNYADEYLNLLKKEGWTVSNFNTTIDMNKTEFGESGLQSVLYEHQKADGSIEYAYVFAGTNSFEDAMQDIAQLSGGSNQYSDAISNAKILHEELNGAELTFVGHSLGGGEATAASLATGDAAITFNTAAITDATLRLNNVFSPKMASITDYKACGMQIMGDLRMGGDILTNAQSKVGLHSRGISIGVYTGIIPTHGIRTMIQKMK